MNGFQFSFDEEKNYTLQKERNISFEEIIYLIEDGNIIDVLEHPNQGKYGGQKIFVLDINGYIWLVPFEEDEKILHLKTAFPSRKFSKLYNK